MQKRRPVMLVVLDGWGWREERADNAVRQAKTPTFDRLWASGPHGFLRTSGRDVGLPPGQMGNSEVGHLNIGAGRVVMQDLPRIGEAIANGEIKQGAGAHRPDRQAQAQRRHLPSASAWSRPAACIRTRTTPPRSPRFCTEPACRRSSHAFTDGRDTPPQSAAEDLEQLSAACRDRCRSPPSSAAITPWTATSAGSAWSRPMTRWSHAEGPHFADAQAAIADAYAHKHVRRVHRAGGDRRLPRHEGRRRRPVLQLPRRPGARNPRRHARSGISPASRASASCASPRRSA